MGSSDACGPLVTAEDSLLPLKSFIRNISSFELELLSCKGDKLMSDNASEILPFSAEYNVWPSWRE